MKQERSVEQVTSVLQEAAAVFRCSASRCHLRMVTRPPYGYEVIHNERSSTASLARAMNSATLCR